MNKTLPQLTKIKSYENVHISTTSERKQEQNDIAIIGIGLKFAESDNLEEFWDVISTGKDCIQRIPDCRKQDLDSYLAKVKRYGKTKEYKQLSYLEHVDQFDYQFFRLSPKEASLMDPNQRLFLQCAYHAIEDAGYANQIEGSNTGVYVGCKSALANVYYDMVGDVESENLDMASVGNKTPIIASRIAYCLDLHGPNMVIDTACSSSLVALHLACQALREEECDTAIVGSVRLDLLPLENMYKLGIESTDGRTRTFDEASDGTGGGEGVAAIFLKPLHKAEKDKDHIYAVIRGTAVNQDGRSIGITAPSAKAQEELVLKAWKKAGINPMSLGYIEAHGTGTRLGDPIEVEALKNAFSRYTQKRQFCAIGSVKANLGHLDNCAGMAGIIKAVLMLKNKKIPPLAHFSVPNTEIDFWNSPFYINQQLKDWDSNTARRCGVSGFGLSGTNAHVVLEEYITNRKEILFNQSLPFIISAGSEKQLMEYVRGFLPFLEKTSLNLYEICYTMALRRKQHKYILRIAVDTVEDLVARLRKWLSEAKENYYEINDFVDEECEKFFPENTNNVNLPLYPFAKNRCWIEVGEIEASSDDMCETAESGVSKIHNSIRMVYEKVLGIKQINENDSFYELGGDSLIALKIVNTLEAQYGIKLEMSDVLVHGSIKALVNYCEQKGNDSSNVASIYSSITKTESRPYYPLSSPQKRMFVMDWYRNIGSVYNMNRAFVVEGALDIEKLKDAFQKIVERHESLRTSFDFIEGEPVQIIHDNVVLDMEIDRVEMQDVENRVRGFFRKFDLKQAPLFRVGVLMVEPEKNILILDMHHIISDGTSTGVIMNEFVELYEGRSLTELPYHYRDYTMWQLTSKKTDEMVRQMNYWKKVFLNPAPVLKLPYDYPRTNQRDFGGKRVENVISKELTASLKKLANEKNTSLHILLLCAYFILLAKYSNQEDIVVGVATSGRNTKLIEGNVGMFVNTLPIRTYPMGSKNVDSFLGEVTDISYEAYRNQDYQLDDLTEVLEIKRDSSRNPLFDAVFTITKFEEIVMKDLKLSVLDYDMIKARFDLIMTMCDYNDHIDFGITYATVLFDSSTITNMLEDYLRILNHICEDTSIKIGEMLTQYDNSGVAGIDVKIDDFQFNL